MIGVRIREIAWQCALISGACPMSLLRTGHTPDAWRDEGPAVHVSHSKTFGARTSTGFVPFVRLPIVQSDAERARQAARVAAKASER